MSWLLSHICQKSIHNPYHVLSNPYSELRINGNNLTVLKDQLCRIGKCFKESSILKKYVHQPMRVPGVVVLTHDEEITNVYSKKKERCKHRLGLEDNGLPFTGIPNLYEVLKTLFDVLEGI